MLKSADVLRMLHESDYFQENDKFEWPENFKVFLSERE